MPSLREARDAFDHVGLFKAIDLMQGPPFGEFLAENVVFKMAAYPVINGRQAAVDFVANFQQNLQSSKHFNLERFDAANDDTVFLQGDIEYVVKKNGKSVVINYLNKLKINEHGKASEYTVFIDPSPLMKLLED